MTDLPTAADLEFINAEHERREQSRALPALDEYAATLDCEVREAHPTARGYQEALAREVREAKHAAELVRRGEVTELTRRMVLVATRVARQRAQLRAGRAIADEPRSSLDALI